MDSGCQKWISEMAIAFCSIVLSTSWNSVRASALQNRIKSIQQYLIPSVVSTFCFGFGFVFVVCFGFGFDHMSRMSGEQEIYVQGFL